MVLVQLQIKQSNPSEKDGAQIEMHCEIFKGEYPTEGEEQIAKGLQGIINPLLEMAVQAVQYSHGTEAAHFEEESDPRVKEDPTANERPNG